MVRFGLIAFGIWLKPHCGADPPPAGALTARRIWPVRNDMPGWNLRVSARSARETPHKSLTASPAQESARRPEVCRSPTGLRFRVAISACQCESFELGPSQADRLTDKPKVMPPAQGSHDSHDSDSDSPLSRQRSGGLRVRHRYRLLRLAESESECGPGALVAVRSPLPDTAAASH